LIKFQLKTTVDVINMRISCRYPFRTLCYKDINFYVFNVFIFDTGYSKLIAQ